LYDYIIYKIIDALFTNMENCLQSVSLNKDSKSNCILDRNHVLNTQNTEIIQKEQLIENRQKPLYVKYIPASNT
jgi:hypothetical protein